MYSKDEIREIVESFLARNNIEALQAEGFNPFDIRINHISFRYIENYSNLSEEDLQIISHNDYILITNPEDKDKFGKPNSLVSNGLKYKKKCPNPIIGVDINLFTEHPEFHYRDDRPKCFYNVRVDGNPSCYETFYDEKVRLDMIINRIQYSGGFIDSNQVLQAQNISRKGKAPSWFQETFASKLIQTYCTENVICDPFAGWGARHDAAVKLGRTYIGGDYNEELVKWHREKGRNISYLDANKFTYEGVCSVLICPPYSDPKTGRCFEDYNFEDFDNKAKSLTQCDWLKICIKNIPNASQYVMVCKVVDLGWEQFEVDVKVNKSHFGVNNEHILKVDNKDRELALSM